MRKIYQILMIAAFVLLSGAVLAQGTVKGIIRDATTDEALLGASAAIEGTTLGTTAGLDGFFEFSAPAGTHVLLLRFVGYETVSMNATVKDGEVTALGLLTMMSTSIGLDEIKVIASVAIDRKTPVAVSTVKAKQIEERLGGRELPQILDFTPSVYATQQGGGYGDGRINIRGFNQRNVAVLINGIPINDMESGWVYWSNWAGLGDAASQIQVQRGLGASTLAVNSVGGTMNVITKTTDAKKGGSFKYEVTDYGTQKMTLSLSTGRMKSGTAVFFVGSRTWGAGYIDATKVDAWSYYLSVSQDIGKKHKLAFTAVGAPQKHDQRYSWLTKSQMDQWGAKYNADWGYRGGEQLNQRKNYYHKPQFAMNWYYDIREKLFLATSAYISTGNGGGSGPLGKYTNTNSLGQIDWNQVVDWNSDNKGINDHITNADGDTLSESQSILRNSANNHMWMGILSTLKIELSDKSKLIVGIDGRSYKGEHYREVRDLMGGSYYYEKYKYATDGAAGRNQIMGVDDKIAYDNDGFVRYSGAFAQYEYTSGNFSAFVSGTISNTWFTRLDRYNFVGTDKVIGTDSLGNSIYGTDQKSEVVTAFGYNGKIGANYNINEKHNVFANAGYYSNAPRFSYVFPNYNNTVAANLENEKVLGFELGYGFTSRYFNAKVNGYYTMWQDKSLLSRAFNSGGADTRALITGLDATHMGIEIEAMAHITDVFDIGILASIGDWEWTNDVQGIITDDDTQVQDTLNIYTKGLKVGDAPQTQLGLKLQYNPYQKINLGLEVIYYDNFYAEFDPADRDVETDREQAYKAPSWVMTNFYAAYKFKIANMGSQFTLNCYNVFDQTYWSDMHDGGGHDEESAMGFYGFGRTFSFGWKLFF
jgi:iron complex outermembrane receptor protein